MNIKTMPTKSGSFITGLIFDTMEDIEIFEKEIGNMRKMVTEGKIPLPTAFLAIPEGTDDESKVQFEKELYGSVSV